MIVPVIMAGGRGARLWPLSRGETPKPFLAMGKGETLLQITLRRIAKLCGLASPVIVCDSEHEDMARQQAAAVFPEKFSLLLEPGGRGTAPALCAAALLVERWRGPDAVLLALPTDHAVANDATFAETVASAAELADAGYLVTFAIKPREPATGYGYLKIGEAIDAGKQQFRVEAFIEKPHRQRAGQFLLSGQFAWNSGIFMFQAAVLIEAFQQFQPEILAACRNALQGDGDRAVLEPKAFAAALSLSIDYAVMEKASNIGTVVSDFNWSDMGDWNAVWLQDTKDKNGVAARGNVLAIDCTGSLVQSDGPVVLGLGLEDMIVIATKDAILVAPRSRAQDVKRAVEELAARGNKP
ncbi:MAG TPA: sugar phosphate nucleotidyltransferase [Aestuariivirga sp.]|nr:sugar phosphate nucleotidyltransferase [Aestuariivirga sp.]